MAYGITMYPPQNESQAQVNCKGVKITSPLLDDLLLHGRGSSQSGRQRVGAAADLSSACMHFSTTIEGLCHCL